MFGKSNIYVDTSNIRLNFFKLRFMKFSSYKHLSLGRFLGRHCHRLRHRRSFNGCAAVHLRRPTRSRPRTPLCPGGYTHVFDRHGYEWDVGLHYIGELQSEESVLRRTFDKITDGQLEWAAMPDVYDRAVIGNRTYDFVSGVERFRARMKGYFPQESDAIDGYIAAVQAAQKAVQPYFIEKAIPVPIAFLIGGFLRAPFLRWANRTTAEVLRRLTGQSRS